MHFVELLIFWEEYNQCEMKSNTQKRQQKKKKKKKEKNKQSETK